MGKMSCISRFVRSVFQGSQYGITQCWHQQNIAVIANACAAEMGMRETVDDGIAVMISAAAVPTAVNTRVGRQLHHAEGKRCTGKSMAVAAGGGERIYE